MNLDNSEDHPGGPLHEGDESLILWANSNAVLKAPYVAEVDPFECVHRSPT